MTIARSCGGAGDVAAWLSMPFRLLALAVEGRRNLMHESDTRRAEFAWLAQAGVAGVKIDFFHIGLQ